jgi:hypothetical protein
MANGTVVKKEEQVTIPRNVMRGYLKETDRLVAWKMHGTMRTLYHDLKELSSYKTSGLAGMSGYADDFKSTHYDVFEKKWNTYRSAFETAYNNPGSETALNRYSKSIRELMNALNMAMPDYVGKRTDLWFRYVNMAEKPMDAAFDASIVTWIATGVEGLASRFLIKGAESVGKEVAKGLIEKSIAKGMFRKELLGTISKILAYPAAGSMAVYMGKGISSGAFVGPAVAREAAERSSFLNAIVNLPPNAKERKDIEDALGKSGAMPEVYLPAIAKTMKEESTPPIGHLSWTMMSIYAVYALPYLSAKVKKPITEAISKALKRKRLMPSTVPMPATEPQW